MSSIPPSRRHSMPAAIDEKTLQCHTPSAFNSHAQLPGIDDQPPPRPYHVFDRRKKLLLLCIVSLGGFFSPLSSNIYFPALGTISKELHVSPSLMALTITVYMVVQGLAPSFWAPFADIYGRRVVFIGTFAVYLAANVVLGATSNYAVLMVFRGVQAAGSAATISIGAGVIGDITTRAERGGYVGTYGGVRMLGQSIGPVFGGVLTQLLGYHSIFWALTILGTIALFLILFFLPETLRRVAGDGSVPLHGIHKPWISVFQKGGKKQHQQPDGKDGITPPGEQGREKPRLTPRDFVAPLRFLFEKDVFVTLVFGGLVYTVWSMVTASTTQLLQQLYRVNSPVLLGLCFLPNGLGCVAGSYLAGVLMDFDYARTRAEHDRHLRRLRKTSASKDANDDDDDDDEDALVIVLNDNNNSNKKQAAAADDPTFPLERARLRSAPAIVATFVLALALYGASLFSPSLDRPLAAQFVVAAASTAIFSINSALTIDLYPGASASATAVNNLMRCSMGAAGVAGVEPLIGVLGPLWAFVGMAAVVAAASPLVWVEVRWGGGWRRERERRGKEGAGERV